MSRALVGRVLVNDTCDFEFVPTAAGSRSYPLELTGITPSIVATVKESTPVIISTWSVTGEGVLVACMDGIAVVGMDSDTVPIAKVDPETPTCQVEGQVLHVSAFLRIKNPSDPFNNCFCVHIEGGKCLILRGPEYVPIRQSLKPGDTISGNGFKRIRIPAFDHLKLYISQPHSVVSSGRLGPSNQLPSADRNHWCVSGSVLQIDVITGEMWVSMWDRPVRVVFGKWGLCERRRISIGCRVKISNCHHVEGVFMMCPSMTSMHVEAIPPISNGVVRVYTITEKAIGGGCLKCRAGAALSTCKAPNPPSKFNVTSLLKCDCPIDCGRTDTAETEILKPQNGFSQCLKDSERCLSIMCISDLYTLAAPPIFRVSIAPACSLAHTGATGTEFAKSLASLPRNLMSLIFTPQKPLNAYAAVRISCITGSETDQITALIPRETRIAAGFQFLIREMIILDTSLDANVHGVVVALEPTDSTEAMVKLGVNFGSDGKSRAKLYRRKLLQDRLDGLGS